MNERLIDANALKREFNNLYSAPEIHSIIDSVKTIPAVPVVNATWSEVIDVDTGILMGFRCSECDVVENFMSEYCRFCGAQMSKNICETKKN